MYPLLCEIMATAGSVCRQCADHCCNHRNFTNNSREDFAVVSGVLRLSSKYLIEESVRTKALAHVYAAWPTSLKGWDAREDLARIYELETGNPRGQRYPHPIVSTPNNISLPFPL